MHPGGLKWSGSVAGLADPQRFRRWLGERYREKWVVYAKAPFGGPESVFRYLGRYTHRVAITNHRLRSLESDHVSFAWKDYADGSRIKVMRLSAEEFLRRFLLHVLPRGFVRIRHYGLLAGGPAPSAKFDRCRQLLGTTGSKASPPEPTRPDRPAWWEEWQAKFAKSRTCPKCEGELHREPWDGRPLAETEPEPATVPTAATVCDSS